MVIDDDPDILTWYRHFLSEEESYKFFYFNSASTAIKQIETQSLEMDLVICDLELGDQTGFDLLSRIRMHYPSTPFCIMTAHASLETSLEALRRGVFDYLPKPLKAAQVKMLIERALHYSEIKKENLRLRETINTNTKKHHNVISVSQPMKDLLQIVERSAPSSASVLILGESGVGKEVIAREIHNLSPRRDELFVAVNCAALPENLIESELFGHKKGSFTGAENSNEGLIRTAQKGTLFLDEIGELPLALQAKLLRFLQEGTVRPVGDNREYSVDVRIVTATNRDIHKQVAEGKFREDLYFRLNVIPVHIPPLRERTEDIAPLLSHFVQLYSSKHNPRVKGISAEAYAMMMKYLWPGNVRELENTIERAVVLCKDEEIQVRDLMLDINRFQKSPPPSNDIHSNGLATNPTSPAPNTINHHEPVAEPAPQMPQSIVSQASNGKPIENKKHLFHFQVESESPLSLSEIEESYIAYISNHTSLTKDAIADRLGINRKTLNRKQKKYGLD